MLTEYFLKRELSRVLRLLMKKKPTVERSAVSLQYSKLGGELYLA